MDTFTTLAQWFIYFILYSVIGYVFEITYCSLHAKQFKNRGFLFGPWCPIYGIGMVLCILVCGFFKLAWYQNFFLMVGICTILEYFTSVILEKIFHARWWDYSTTTRFNLNGRISLETSLKFGVGCMIVLYLVHPVIAWLVHGIPEFLLIITAIMLFIIFMTDFVLSTLAVIGVREHLTAGRIDLTSEIKFLIRRHRQARRKKRRERRHGPRDRS